MGYIGMQTTALRIAALGLLMVILPFIGYSQSKRAFLIGISDYTSNQHLADGKGWNDIQGRANNSQKRIRKSKNFKPSIKVRNFDISRIIKRKTE